MGEWRNSSDIFTLALDGDECSTSRPGRFIPRERAGGKNLPQSRSGRCELEKTLLPCLKSNPDRSVRSPSLYRLN
jgi:hypothetical protein